LSTSENPLDWLTVSVRSKAPAALTTSETMTCETLLSKRTRRNTNSTVPPPVKVDPRARTERIRDRWGRLSGIMPKAPAPAFFRAKKVVPEPKKCCHSVKP
jgi:hypothetical protein